MPTRRSTHVPLVEGDAAIKDQPGPKLITVGGTHCRTTMGSSGGTIVYGMGKQFRILIDSQGTIVAVPGAMEPSRWVQLLMLKFSGNNKYFPIYIVPDIIQ